MTSDITYSRLGPCSVQPPFSRKTYDLDNFLLHPMITLFFKRHSSGNTPLLQSMHQVTSPLSNVDVISAVLILTMSKINAFRLFCRRNRGCSSWILWAGNVDVLVCSFECAFFWQGLDRFHSIYGLLLITWRKMSKRG
jgi:hypothetical protein